MPIIGYTTIYIHVKYFHPSQNILWKIEFQHTLSQEDPFQTIEGFLKVDRY